VLKAAQAVSGEIVLGKLIETLLRIAVEHAGAGRGTAHPVPGRRATDRGGSDDRPRPGCVTLRQTAVSPAELPESVLHYVIRTRESVILDDALAQNLFSADEYLCQKHARSVLCLPLVKQTKLIGCSSREQAARMCSRLPGSRCWNCWRRKRRSRWRNGPLYNDLGKGRQDPPLVDSNIVGIVIWDFRPDLEANEAFLDIVGYAREDLRSVG